MGTNYYTRITLSHQQALADAVASHPDEEARKKLAAALSDQLSVELHIGKAIGCLQFLFQAWPDLDPPLTSFGTWMRFLENRRIYDEHGKDVPLDRLRQIIAERDHQPTDDQRVPREFISSDGHRFCPDDFT